MSKAITPRMLKVYKDHALLEGDAPGISTWDTVSGEPCALIHHILGIVEIYECSCGYQLTRSLKPENTKLKITVFGEHARMAIADIVDLE